VSETTESLRRKIASAGDLEGVVRTMKALAASNIGQYEKAVSALGDYYRSVEMGLGVCFQKSGFVATPPQRQSARPVVGAVVFGSDQGLVGRFNDAVTEYASTTLSDLPEKPIVWAVGERAHARLQDLGLSPTGLFLVPNSVKAISQLVGQVLTATEQAQDHGAVTELLLFHNRPAAGASYFPVTQRLLPLDESWRGELAKRRWPTGNLPEAIGGVSATLPVLIREYLFVSLFRACAESLASENASRLAAMQRAEKNIDEMLVDLHGAFHRVRQSGIDEELFDVISGFESQNAKNK
jgi:F-type H+-transporting ATPase subunit gamma